MDLDMEDLDGTIQKEAPRASRFAPKSFKPKPKGKSEPKPEQLKELESSSAMKSDPVVKKKEDVDEPATAMPREEALNFNGSVKMEVDAKPHVAETVQEDVMDMNNEEVANEVEEDVVVREIDCFFNPSLDPSTKLYVLQYPLRPCWRPYELDERCDEVRVKPESSEFEMDLSIDADSKNFDKESANRFNMTKQKLSTTWRPTRTSGYAVGVLMGEQLHLNPVHAVVQLRPSMEHLNTDGLKRKTSVTGNTEAVMKQETTEEKLTGPQTEECWVKLKYHGSKSDFSSRYLQRMIAQESSPIHFTMSPCDYVDSLCPGASNNTKGKGHSRRLLLSMPLEERIKKLLCEGPPMQRFSVIKHFAPDASDEDIFRELNKYTLLVQGLWVPKTNWVLPQGSGLQCFSRDYVLLLFSKNTIVQLSQINAFPSNVARAMTQFLNLFARERQCFKDWKFKEPTDISFLRSYPEFVEKQKLIWASIEDNITVQCNKLRKSGSSMKNASMGPSLANKSEKSILIDKAATKSTSGTLSGKSLMTNETREALPKALLKLFQIHKVCSFQLICQGLRNLAVNNTTLPKVDATLVSAADAVDTPDELKIAISQVALEINGVYALKSSTEHPELDPLRRVVMDLFRVNGRNAKITRAEIFGAAKEALGRDVTTNEYAKVMRELCEARGSHWVLKSGDGSSK